MKPIHYILLILLGLLIITGIASFILFNLWRNSNELANQRFENLFQTVNLKDQQIILQTQQELEQLMPEIKLLIDSLNINHVTHVHQTNYHYSNDSIITILVPLDSHLIDSSLLPIKSYSFSIDTLCVKIKGIADIDKQNILFSNISFNDKITTLYFWQRKRLFGWSWTPKWGKKQFRAQTHSNCTDSISTLDIQIQKY